MELQVLDASSSREDLIEALGHVCREAKRAQTVIGTPAHPSRWDNLHEFLDSLLDMLVGK